MRSSIVKSVFGVRTESAFSKSLHMYCSDKPEEILKVLPQMAGLHPTANVIDPFCTEDHPF